MSGKKYVFYHIFCNDKTLYNVKDTITKMIFSGLYHKVDKIHCFIVGNKQYADVVIEYIKSSGSKFDISEISENDNSYERFTLLQIPKYIQPEDKFLYIHSKGVSRKDIVQIECVHDWKTYMEYWLFNKHQECIDFLEDYDVVGVNYRVEPRRHFSGNFWWCRGDYYLSLNQYILFDNNYYIYYFLPEMYVCSSDNVRVKELFSNKLAGYYEKCTFLNYV